jgi:hypothetical protein
MWSKTKPGELIALRTMVIPRQTSSKPMLGEELSIALAPGQNNDPGGPHFQCEIKSIDFIV